MSWLSELFRKAKGGKTDAEFIFGIAVSAMSFSTRNKLTTQLRNVKYAIDIASTVSKDVRINEAQKWVNGGLAELEQYE